ncbi:hypothetical protein Tco_0816630 [Tanacetum coccineum]
MGYFQIIRADGSSRRYSSTIRMFQNIDREDLETLWKLVKANHGNTRTEELVLAEEKFNVLVTTAERLLLLESFYYQKIEA